MERKDILSNEVDRVVDILSRIEPTSDEYSKGIQNLKVLCEARAKKPASWVEAEVLVSVLSNLLGIVLILRHEQFNVVTSKALNFIRPK